MHLRRAWKKTNYLASPATSTGTITVDEAWAPRTLPSLAESTRCADWKTGQRPLYLACPMSFTPILSRVLKMQTSSNQITTVCVEPGTVSMSPECHTGAAAGMENGVGLNHQSVE